MAFVPLLPLWLALAPAAPQPPPPESPTDLVAELPPYHDRLGDALSAVPGGLTSDEVARRAVLESPAVELRRADLQATAATVDETIARFVPSVRLEATYTRLSPAEIDFGTGGASVGALNPGGLTVGPCPGATGTCVLDSAGVPVAAQRFDAIEVPLDNYSLRAALSVPFSDYALRLVPARRGAREETKSAVLRRDAEKVSVQLNARLAYYDWLRARAQVAVAEQSLERMRARLEDARVGEAAGTLTSTDVLRLDGLVASAEAALMRARSFEQFAAQNVAVIMGETKNDFVVGENVMAPPRTVIVLTTREALIEEAMQKRLEVRALEHTAQALDAARKLANGSMYPRVDGFAEGLYANPNQRFFPMQPVWNGSWAVGATLSWQLDAFLLARSQSKRVHANERTNQANLAAMRQAIELEVTSAWEERQRADATLQLTARSLLAAEAAYDQQIALYQAGEATTTDVIEAEAERTNATLQDVNARIDIRVANAKLLRASGRMEPLAVDADRADRRYEKMSSGGRRNTKASPP